MAKRTTKKETTSKVSAALQAKLKKAREKFAKADPAESNTTANRNVPDGTYTAQLVGLEFDEFGKHPILRFSFKITDADKKAHEPAIDQVVESRFSLDTDEGPSFIKRDFGKFGYDDMNDLLDDIPAACETFEEVLSLEPVCKIMVAMDDSDQWQNVYLNAVVEMNEDEGDEQKADDEATSTDDEEGEEEGDGKGEEEGASTDDAADDEEELNVGDIVQTEYNGKDVIGSVTKIDEENDLVSIKCKKPRKVIKVSSADVYIVEG